MDIEARRKDYEEIFSVDENGQPSEMETLKNKAKAFDKIAERYYLGNFGTMQKSDFEVLLFSIYLEQILDKKEEDMNSYSDYELSKKLGITQDKIRNLKVKKELKYPYEKFKWKESFKRVCEDARFENGKFEIDVRDPNLYIELKNQIERDGGYVDVTLNKTLLKVAPYYYINLIMCVMDEPDREKIIKSFNQSIKEQNLDIEELTSQTHKEILYKNRKKLTNKFISGVFNKVIDFGISNPQIFISASNAISNI